MSDLEGKTPEDPDLVFGDVDPEAKIGLPVGRNTNPAGFNSFLLGLIFCGAIYLLVYLVVFQFGIGDGSETVGATTTATASAEPPPIPKAWLYLTGFNKIPIGIALLTCWSLALLALKALKIRAQRRAATCRAAR